MVDALGPRSAAGGRVLAAARVRSRAGVRHEDPASRAAPRRLRGGPTWAGWRFAAKPTPTGRRAIVPGSARARAWRCGWRCWLWSSFGLGRRGWRRPRSRSTRSARRAWWPRRYRKTVGAGGRGPPAPQPPAGGRDESEPTSAELTSGPPPGNRRSLERGRAEVAPWWLAVRSRADRGTRRRRRGAARSAARVLDRDLDEAERLLSRSRARLDPPSRPYLALAPLLYRMRGEIGRAIRVHQNLLLRATSDGLARPSPRCSLAADFRQGRLPPARDRGLRGVMSERAEARRRGARRPGRAPRDGRDYPRALELARRRAARSDATGVPTEAELWDAAWPQAAHAEGRSDEARARSEACAARARPERPCARGSPRRARGRARSQQGRARGLAREARPLDRSRAGHAGLPAARGHLRAGDRPATSRPSCGRLDRAQPDDLRGARSRWRAPRRRGARSSRSESCVSRCCSRDPEDLEARSAPGPHCCSLAEAASRRRWKALRGARGAGAPITCSPRGALE